MTVFHVSEPVLKDELLAWAEVRVESVSPFERDKSAVAMVTVDGEISAVSVYSNLRGGNIEMTIAADTPRWATRGAIADLLSWPFECLPGLRRITALVNASNTRSRKLVEGLGFQMEGWLEDGADDGDLVLYGMTRKMWLASRWMRVVQARAA